MICSLKEVTPDMEDLELPLVKEFLHSLVSSNSNETTNGRYVVPTPEFTAANGHPVTNALASYRKDRHRLVFGFIVFVDIKMRFLRANAHTWLEDKKTNEWVDPSPLVDNKEPSGSQYLLRSDALFTVHERLCILKSPSIYCLGGIINRAFIPDIFQLGVSQVFNENVNIKAHEHRLIIIHNLGRGGGQEHQQPQRNVVLDMKTNTYSTSTTKN